MEMYVGYRQINVFYETEGIQLLHELLSAWFIFCPFISKTQSYANVFYCEWVKQESSSSASSFFPFNHKTGQTQVKPDQTESKL